MCSASGRSLQAQDLRYDVALGGLLQRKMHGFEGMSGLGKTYEVSGFGRNKRLQFYTSLQVYFLSLHKKATIELQARDHAKLQD